MNENSNFYNPNISSQLPYDFLSFPLPMNDGNPTAGQEFPNSFFSNCEENSSSGLNASDFYGQNIHVSPQDVSFLSQNSLSTPLSTPNYCTPSMHPLQDNLEEFLTPLISPAITPNYTDIYEFLDPPSDQFFTPLSSPALPPSITNCFHENNSPILTASIENNVLLSQQLAQIETKQQLLREQINNSSNSPVTYRKSPLALFSNRNQAPPSPLPFSGSKRTSLRQKIALSSPQLSASQNHHITLPTTPATPASLMKMTHQPSSSINNTFTNTINTRTADRSPSLAPSDNAPPIINKKRKLAPSSPATIVSSPRTLKPQMSPFLQPSLKMNATTFTPIVENRRSAHKVAEQKRRDTLKQSFDSLRKEITDVLVMDETNENKKLDESIRDEKEKEVKLMSKVLLLQHSYEYIIRLKNEGKRKDEKMQKMQSELDNLRSTCDISNSN